MAKTKKTAAKKSSAARSATEVRPRAPRARRGGAKPAGAGAAPALEPRRAEVLRETSETRIDVRLGIDEPGYSISTGVPFLDHMLEALSRHSGIGMQIAATGDTHIDDHHTVEDVGLAIGEALRRALGEKAGIARFGHFETPLDEALVAVTVDLSGRPYLVYNVPLKPQRVGTFDVGLVEDFMQALMTAAGMNLHVNVRYGRNPHHIIEATFKALAKALAMACARDARVQGVPSTKGTLQG
ncbi:MAG TPA: imidazoleglycerol-phosphate dehydratase HisB [Candidatus Limnocylindrales bacterium]|nr:imidazoleglycerol-phosphate dehydratase HisB [Candidatus Limnocylindrales bacterium]